MDAVDAPKEDAFQETSFPGEYPFTRGVQPTMYRGRLWTMRQYAGFGSAEQTNQRFHELLKAGQTGLSMAFDLPTQMGFDPDEDMARGEVGRVGVSISTIDDMETVLKDLPLDQISTSMTINATSSILLCFYIAVAKKRGIDPKKLRGTIQNDILKEYIARGTYIYPPKPSMRIISDLIEYCTNEVPLWNPISISGYHIREAGSDAVQEIAFTLSNACAYSQAAIDKGLSFDDFASRLSFFFASHNNLIEEIAKFRAARQLWAEIAKERFGAKKEKSMLLRFHAQTGGSTLTAQQPDNNIVRTTIQALAAILGGCQSLHTNSKDEALSLPTKESATLALRTQHILAEESGVANTIDPVAGSFTIEEQTQRLYKAAKEMIQKVDDLGGSVAAVDQQFFQKQIAERAYEFQQQVESNERGIVGVNRYQTEETQAPDILKMNVELEQNQIQKLEHFKQNRDAQTVQNALQTLSEAANSPENLIPLILHAVESKASLGEIAHTFRKVFGVYTPS